MGKERRHKVEQGPPRAQDSAESPARYESDSWSSSGVSSLVGAGTEGKEFSNFTVVQK